MTTKSLIESVLDRSWSDNLNQRNIVTKQKWKTTPHKNDEQTSVALGPQNQTVKNKIYVKITY